MLWIEACWGKFIYCPLLSFPFANQSDQFQADIFPKCPGDKPSITANEYFAGKSADPILIDLEKGYVSKPKEFVAQAPVISGQETVVQKRKKMSVGFNFCLSNIWFPTLSILVAILVPRRLSQAQARKPRPSKYCCPTRRENTTIGTSIGATFTEKMNAIFYYSFHITLPTGLPPLPQFLRFWRGRYDLAWHFLLSCFRRCSFSILVIKRRMFIY